MKNYCLMMLYLVFVISSDVHALHHKAWTFLIYMVAENSTIAQQSLQEIAQVGSGLHAHVLVYCSVQLDEKRKQTKKLSIEEGKIIQVGPHIERDAGDVVSLVEALQWAHLDYPSDHIAVILSGQGSGPLNRNGCASRGICYDSDSGNYLTDRDCFNALSWICTYARGGKKIDIIACDASYMASIEMAYTFAPYADYFIASQGKVNEHGFYYGDVLTQLKEEVITPLSCAKTLVTSYGKGHHSSYTLSLIKLHDVTPLFDNINAVGQILSSYIRGKNGILVKGVVKKCMNKHACALFDDGAYIDVCQFYKNMLKNVSELKLSNAVGQSFRQLLVDGIALFSRIVHSQIMSKHFKQLGGLSIYFSRHSLDPSYYGLYWSAYNSAWLDLLEAFISV